MKHSLSYFSPLCFHLVFSSSIRTFLKRWTFIHHYFFFRIETFIVLLSVVPVLDCGDTILIIFQPGSFATSWLCAFLSSSCWVYHKSCPFHLGEVVLIHCLFSLPSPGWFHIFPPCLPSSGVSALHFHTPSPWHSANEPTRETHFLLEPLILPAAHCHLALDSPTKFLLVFLSPSRREVFFCLILRHL